MNPVSASPDFDDLARQRAAKIFQNLLDVTRKHTDRMFAWLMTFQWMAGLSAAIWISPRAWEGRYNHMHLHVLAALLLGGIVTSFPVYLALTRPGTPLTRQGIAVGQMLTSVLLVHLTGGRIETHFHIFGSLAFLAFYRDWRVLASATLVVAADHFVRGLYWPESIFGVMVADSWRWLEHVGWVIFEDIFLMLSIRQNLREKHGIAERQARLEGVNETVERKVAARTTELQDEIAERRRTMQELDRIFTLSLDMLCLAGFDGFLKRINPACEHILGWTTEEFLTRPFMEIIHPEDRERTMAELKRLAEGDDSTLFEIRICCKDGSYRWVLWNATPVPGGQQFYASGRDITERKRMENHLNAQTAARLVLAESSNLEQAIPKILQSVCQTLGWDLGDFWSVDRQTQVLRCTGLWSASHVRLDEFARESWEMTFVRGKGLPGRIWDSRKPEWVTNVVADNNFPRSTLANRAGLHGAFAFPILSRCEVVHVMEFFSHEVREPDDGLLRMFANISSQFSQFLERSHLAEQLVQSQKMETVGKLAGGVAHEFNSIMTAIIGQSELMLSDLSTGNPLAKNATEIRKAADRAATLTRQLLAYGRKQILRPEMLDLNQIIMSLEGVLRHLMGGDVDLRLVPSAGSSVVKADAGQIEQVIMNIAINAREAMPRGGKLTLEVANMEVNEDGAHLYPALKPGPYVLLAITDTGGGMKEEVLARAFEPFFSTKGVGEGTGLGLATCYGIVKQSNGHITVYSEPSKGTSFKIYLPLAKDETESAPRAPEPARLPGGTETVLLVEDDPALREMATTLLRRLGYFVLAAPDGIAALNLVAQRGSESINLLFTDLVMPKLNGKELSDRILASRPQTRVLFTSAYTENAIIHQEMLNPGVALIQKPFTPGALARKVREVLDKN